MNNSLRGRLRQLIRNCFHLYLIYVIVKREHGFLPQLTNTVISTQSSIHDKYCNPHYQTNTVQHIVREYELGHFTSFTEYENLSNLKEYKTSKINICIHKVQMKHLRRTKILFLALFLYSKCYKSVLGQYLAIQDEIHKLT